MIGTKNRTREENGIRSKTKLRDSCLHQNDRNLNERLGQISPRFAAPSDDLGCVMPVGSGDLSAMLRYGKAYEMHLSKSDYYAMESKPYHRPQNIHSPGHLSLSFGIEPSSILKFEQTLDLSTGSVVLKIKTIDGNIHARTFGIMGENVLVVAVEDTRRDRIAQAEYSCWRESMKVSESGGFLVSKEVHDYDETGEKVLDSTKVGSNDRMYNLGVGTVVAFFDDAGMIKSEYRHKNISQCESGSLGNKPPSKYWFLISTACTYDGNPEKAAQRQIELLLKHVKSAWYANHLAWWEKYWSTSYMDLYGGDAEYLMKLWYVSLYSYACTKGAPHAPVRYNGGPGLIRNDDRSWGYHYVFQNTRELIWPMGTAGKFEFAREYLDFYDAMFMPCKRWTAQQGKIGIRMEEGVFPFKAGSKTEKKETSQFNPEELEKAINDHRMEDVVPGYNNHSLCQAAELSQLMLDYVSYTGDKEFLADKFAPWLKESTLFFLSYLKLGKDGLYHMTPSNAIEMWWKVKDPITDLCALRFLFWNVINFGQEFGYEAEFIMVVRERLAKIPEFPTGRWEFREIKPEERKAHHPAWLNRMYDHTEYSDKYYAPAAEVLDEKPVWNQEHPELYIVYPFAIVDYNSPESDYRRALNTFKVRKKPNSAGWSQCPVQAARLRLPNAVEVIMDHAKKHQIYPYGGWNCVSAPLKESKLKLSDTPHLDPAGVNMTALQEILMQSHFLTTPEKRDPLSGGPIVLLPCVPDEWKGRFKLYARGGFIITTCFSENRKIESLEIQATRNATLKLMNPFSSCKVLLKETEIGLFQRDEIVLYVNCGDVLTMIEASE